MEPKAPPISFLDRYHGDVFQPLYTADVTVTGGVARHARASGVARSTDGELDVQLRLPPALGGPGGGTNPEQLFAAGYAACFHGALSLLAAHAGIPIPGASVEVTVDFGRAPMDGRRKVKGLLRGIDGDAVRVETADGVETVAFADIGRARLVPRIEWRKS